MSVRIGATVRRVPIEAVVFVCALAARVAVILRYGGLRGSFGYDSSVYFAAADAFVHGRLPYRDFVLLHPPGLMLALTPFAALTHVTSDASAFATAALAFCVLGAVNAVLVVRVARRLGLGGAGAAVGGVFYALWFGAVGAEYLARLEPLGNLMLLLVLLAMLRDRPRRRDDVLAGVCLGLLVSVKIWWAVPVVVLAVWHGRRSRSPHRTGLLMAGAAASLAAVDLPFFVAAPRAMWASVVSEQVGRQANSSSPWLRLGDISSVSALDRALSTPVLLVVSAVVLATGALVLVRAWSVPRARPVVVLLVAQLAVVLLGPSWFGFYSDYLAVAASLAIAAAAAQRRRSVGAFVTRAWVATTAAITVIALALGTVGVRPLPAAPALTRAVADTRCVMSDSPMGLIEVDALSRGLAHGCANWVDVTGRTYGPDRGPASRFANRRWQRDLRAYLRSGGAVIVVRATGTGLTRSTWRAIRRDGALTHSGGQAVYRTGTSGPGHMRRQVRSKRPTRSSRD